jgi:putative restriction endonuclease
MAAGKRWTRDELLIVLNLYHKLRFGQISSRLPAIIDLANKMGRTPSSVSMKLGNLASFDPVLQLRGIRGLPGTSNLDREVWEEFHANPSELVPLSQEQFDALFVDARSETTEVIPDIGIQPVSKPPTGETETMGLVKQRRGQGYFRDTVLNNYDNRCAITGLPVRELLIASHILSWSGHETERLNVRNGIALNRLHDAAFDQGFISFDDNLRLLLSKRLHDFLSHEAVKVSFADYNGQPLHLPADAIPPDPTFLAKHRTRHKVA